MERFRTEEGGRLRVINTLGIVHKVWILYYYVRVFDQHQMVFSSSPWKCVYINESV